MYNLTRHRLVIQTSARNFLSNRTSFNFNSLPLVYRIVKWALILAAYDLSCKVSNDMKMIFYTYILLLQILNNYIGSNCQFCLLVVYFD